MGSLQASLKIRQVEIDERIESHRLKIFENELMIIAVVITANPIIDGRKRKPKIDPMTGKPADFPIKKPMVVKIIRAIAKVLRMGHARKRPIKKF